VRAIESARRHAVAACLACVACFVVVLVFAYEVAAVERLDERLLDAISSPPGTFAYDVASFFERLADPLSEVLAIVLACVLALVLGRPRRGVLAVALVAGTAVIVQVLKIALQHPRYQPVPGEPFDWYPVAKAFPSGHSAGSLSMALAFLVVVPSSWQRPTTAIGICFTSAVSASLLILNYHYPSDILGGWLVASAWFFALLAVPWFSAGPPPRPHARPWRLSGRSPGGGRRAD
jgi:membrane-associated phospholipid phosphatase